MKLLKYLCPHFWFKKREIVFYGKYPHVDKINPIVKSSDFKREWIKKAQFDFNSRLLEKNQNHVTAGYRCFGIQSLFKQGFILKSEQEFAVETTENDDDIKIHTSGGAICAVDEKTGYHPSINNFGFFSEDLLGTYTCPIGAIKHNIKMDLPWNLDCPKDIVFLSIPVYYPDDNRFISTPAIFDPSIANQINVIFWWFVKNSYEIVRKGTPFAQIIPIPRNSICDNWKMVDRTPDKIYDKTFAMQKVFNLTKCGMYSEMKKLTNQI